MCPGNADTEQAGVAHVVVVLGRKAGIAVIRRGSGCETRASHATREAVELGFLVAEAEGLGIEDRRVGVDVFEVHDVHRTSSSFRHASAGGRVCWLAEQSMPTRIDSSATR